MDTHPPQEPDIATAATPATGTSRTILVRRSLIALAAAGVIVWACSAVSGFFGILGGGSVRSAADFRKRDIATLEAGRQTIIGLGPGAGVADQVRAEGSTACVDDLGSDRHGVTRHEPHYEWDLHYAGKADYLAGLGKLRTAWGHRGWKVHDTPPPEGSTPGRPVPNWPGLSTTDDHGITIAIYLDEYTHTPTLSTSGGCIRYDRDDGVTARKRTGAGEQPAREGAITYDDGVQVTIGPIQAITPNPGMKDEGAADGHTYLLPVIVTNRSGAPVELRDGIGARKGANPGVRWLPGYSLLPGGPATVPEGSSTRLETVFTAQTLPSHMNISYQPSELHASYDWQLTTR